MMKKERFWDRIAKNYDIQVNEDDQEGVKIVEKTKKYLHESDTVLDFACATGKFTFEFAEGVKEVHGIDISSEMIAIARKNAAEHDLAHVHFAQAAIEDDRFEKGAFDVILAFNILHLLEDPGRAIQRINELLKPGGVFISATACMARGLSFLRFILWPLSKTGLLPHINFFRPSDVESLITGEDFDIVETEVLSPSPPNLLVVARKTENR